MIWRGNVSLKTVRLPLTFDLWPLTNFNTNCHQSGMLFSLNSPQFLHWSFIIPSTSMYTKSGSLKWSGETSGWQDVRNNTLSPMESTYLAFSCHACESYPVTLSMSCTHITSQITYQYPVTWSMSCTHNILQITYQFPVTLSMSCTHITYHKSHINILTLSMSWTHITYHKSHITNHISISCTHIAYHITYHKLHVNILYTERIDWF